VVLNVTADHLDRIRRVAAYALAKSRIFAHAATVVLNVVDDPLVAAMRGGKATRTVTFSIERRDADFTLVQERCPDSARSSRRRIAGRFPH